MSVTTINAAEGKKILANAHSELNKGVIGNHKVIDLILLNMLLKKGHVLFSGVPGVAKTHLLKCLANAINSLVEARVSCTPDLLPSTILGGPVFDRVKQQMVALFGPAILKADGRLVNFLLLDEINRTSPKAQAAFLEMMEEGQVTVGDETLKLPPFFMVCATYNPLDAGGTGTFPINHANKDRFMSSGYMGYLLSPEEEMEMIDKYHAAHGNLEGQVKPVVSVDQILGMRAAVEDIAENMSPAAKLYMARLVFATRPPTDEFENPYFEQVHSKDTDALKEMVEYGSSPRGSISLSSLAAAHAYMDGRETVTPADIKFAAGPALLHRISLSPAFFDRKPKEVLDKVLNRVSFDEV